ncbi:hypothetical protein BpHYR1_043615 [Brachionus plicatilis]|uniref:G-protein coupled receptors family 1 profile domain-containing protein n=1 Tax=Brachionus plicatilis TaxID=10195 RepID=A0A3M7QA67_BRAPC|nr:hypothetical protein BpHYR1_043615 [Brachionus plicatilis]
MNNGTNLTIDPLNLLRIKIFSFISNIGNVYIVPPLCSLGFLLNILCIITFIRLCKQGNIFKYFLVKTIAESIILFTGALIPLGFCIQCSVYQSLPQMIHQYILVGYLIPVSYTFSGFCEIIITVDRILILKNKEKNSISYKVVMIVILILSVFMFLPLLFSRYLKELPENKFVLLRTAFGSSADFSIYLSITVLVRNTFFFVSLVVSNILLLVQFRKYIDKKYKLFNGLTRSKDLSNSSSVKSESSNNKKDDPEKRLTRMTLTLSLIFILSRGLQSVGSISSSIDKGNQIQFNPFTTIFNFCSNVVNYLVYSSIKF